MPPQLTPAAGREDGRFVDLGMRPGESDSARMLSGVLLLVIATISIVAALVWWLF